MRLRLSERENLLRDLIKTARIEKGLKQHQVAKKLAYTQSYISKIERGERKLTAIDFFDICMAIDADPSKLLMQIPPRIKGRQGRKKR